MKLHESTCKSLLSCLQNAKLHWDHIERAKELVSDPEEFWTFFKKTHSKLLCELITSDNLESFPVYMVCGDPWLEAIAKWRLSL